MHRNIVVAFCLLAMFLSCTQCGSAQADAGTGPDWKWSYAQTYSEEQIAASGMKITADDIAFARGRVADAEEDCADRGGVWCDYAEQDKNALQKMLNVQARQTNNPSPAVVDTGPISDLTNIIDSAFKQLVAIVNGILGWD